MPLGFRFGQLASVFIAVSGSTRPGALKHIARTFQTTALKHSFKEKTGESLSDFRCYDK